METTIGRRTSRRAAFAGTQGRLPDFVIVGGMKCGTTSLHRYLELHPEIFVSRKKELKFFVDARNGNWSRGLDWYRAQFADAGSRLAGESTPEYTKRTIFPDVAQRMHDVIPGARLLYILRDPVERMLSHWVHMRASGRETRSAAQALLATDRNPYLDCSSYAMQLEPYLELFPRECIFVTKMEDLQRDPAGTMRKVFAFLGIDQEFTSDEFRNVYHSSSKKKEPTFLYRVLARVVPRKVLRRMRESASLATILERPITKPTLADSVKSELASRLREDVAQLREITGLHFDDWFVSR